MADVVQIWEDCSTRWNTVGGEGRLTAVNITSSLSPNHGSGSSTAGGCQVTARAQERQERSCLSLK